MSDDRAIGTRLRDDFVVHPLSITMEQHPNTSLNPNGHDLLRRLDEAQARRTGRKSGQRINVPGVGSLVSAAYEQLRNAAEYMQEHLLRQRAIRRFYVRNLSFGTRKEPAKTLSDELIIELTQAGYIENDSLAASISDELMKSIRRHYDNYWRMRDSGVTHSYANSLALDLMSVEGETLIADDDGRRTFTRFAYNHYLVALKEEAFTGDSKKRHETFAASLYVAIHKALLKSDLATIRYDMQRLQEINDDDIDAYVRYYVTVDGIYFSEMNDKLSRHISRYGAPLRVLKSLLEADPGGAESLPHRDDFMAAYRAQIQRMYDEANVRLNKGVVKSLVFLLLTKAIVGLAIEIPYDLLLTGTIAILPLVINLMAPIVYMVTLRAGLRLPGPANTEAVMVYAENMLYGAGSRELYAAPSKKKYSIGFRVAYVLMFFIVFGLVSSQLIAWDFNMMQGIIFFIFFGTATFLGFRLSRLVRELELITTSRGVLAALRDFLYLPFVLLGQWLSDKYARVNIIALFLDTAIELPLKTMLRLIRQWTDFISDKKDSI